MKRLVCESCGAPLDPGREVCEYCGSRYKITYEGPTPIYQMLESPKAIRVKAVETISSDIARQVFTPNEMREIVLGRLTEAIAREIQGATKYETHRDLNTGSLVVSGEVRIVPPDVRF